MIKFELNEKYRRNVSEDEMIADLKRVASQLGKDSVTKKEYDKNGKYYSETMRRKIGSWFKILSKAGLYKTRNLGLTDEDLVGDLIRVSQKLKKDSITTVEYEQHGEYSKSVFQYHFGTWFKALEKAGLKKTRNLDITDEEYFENLEEVWIKLGKQPKYNDMQKPSSRYCAGAYENRFGTWRKALERFIEYVTKEEVVTQSEVEDYPIINPPAKIQNSLRHKTKRNISSRLRFIIMKRDNFKCKNCGRSPATDSKIILHVDHITAYSNGGETVLNNLQTLCSLCNIGKSNL